MQVNTISYYEENAKSLISRYESADINEVQELLLQTFYKNSKLFEIGCGPGNITKYLIYKNPNYKILATDAAPNMIALAKKNNPTVIKDKNNINEKKFFNDNFIAIHTS